MNSHDRSISCGHRRTMLLLRLLLILSLIFVAISTAWTTVTPAAAQDQACYYLDRGVTPTGAGNISVWPAPNCNGTQYLYGTTVTLTAVPYNNYTFAYWTGNASGTSSTTTIGMYGPRSVVANFTYAQACYSLTTSVSPNGSGSIAISPPRNCNNGTQYTPGTVVEMTAYGGPGYTFSKWTGGAAGSQNPYYLYMDRNYSITANFTYNQICYTLATSVSPNGSGSIALSPPPNCSNGTQYLPNTVVSMTPYAGPGYTFTNWSGSASGTVVPYNIIMDGPKSVTARFSLACYTLNYSVSPAGSGAITVNPLPNCANGTQYQSGSMVRMTANPNPGFSFNYWSGNVSGSANPLDLLINGSKSVVANFTAQPPSISSISPDMVLVGGPAFTLSLTGSNFDNNAIVTWNDNNLSTQWLSSQALEASVPASAISMSGIGWVKVYNPNTGQISPAVGVSVGSINPAPILLRTDPISLPPNGQPAVLQLIGSDFTIGAQVYWNNNLLPTTFIKSTTLQVAVPGNYLDQVAYVQLKVVNPAPGGGTSTPLTFGVLRPIYLPAVFK